MLLGVPLEVGEEPCVPDLMVLEEPDAMGRVADVELGLVTAGGGVYVVAKVPLDASKRSSDAFAGADCAYPIKV